ncbi:MAG: hypothetical protein ABI729_06460 [Chitinophagales bacterium]
MKTMTVGELKAKFSEVLDLVMEGEAVYVSYGKKKEIVAQLVPYKQPGKKKRKLGGLKGKVTFKFMPDFKMTEKELLNL